MNTELYKIALKYATEVYQDNIDLGTTEFRITKTEYNGETINIIAIAGSNELLDWWKNFMLFSWKGFKLAAYQAAKQIFNSKQYAKMPKRKLLITGHSKAGATVPAFLKIFGGTWGIAFNPAPSMRRWTNRKINNLTLFIHKNDPVSMAGIINFGHPICETFYAEKGKGYDVSNHLISLWDRYIEIMGD